MKKDDWKYYEEAWDESLKEEKPPLLPPEKQCRICLHWIDQGAIYCSWCGKLQEEKKKS